MILETNFKLDKLYMEVVKVKLKKKYNIVKDIRLTNDGYRLSVIFKKNVESFSNEYWSVKYFIESLFPPNTWFGDLTYTISLVKKKYINVI